MWGRSGRVLPMGGLESSGPPVIGSLPWSSSAVCGYFFPVRLLLSSCLGKLMPQQSVVFVLSDSKVRLFKQEAAALPALSSAPLPQPHSLPCFRCLMGSHWLHQHVRHHAGCSQHHSTQSVSMAPSSELKQEERGFQVWP